MISIRTKRRSAARAAVYHRLAVLFGILPGALAGIAFSIARAHPIWVDEIFVARWYPHIRLLASRAASLPFAIAPIAAVAVGLWAAAGLAVSIIRSAYQGSMRPICAALYRRAAAAGLAYCLLMSMWGIQYARTPLMETYEYIATAESSSAVVFSAAGLNGLKSPVEQLCEKWISQANALRKFVRAVDPERILRQTPAMFAQARRAAKFLPDGPIPQPKPSGIDGMLSRMMIEGVYIPFTFEPLVNISVPTVDLPFVACHEVAHSLGFAREDEANFVAYTVCMLSSEPAFIYSGVMTALRYSLARLAQTQPRQYWALLERMSPAVRQEYTARSAYWNEMRNSSIARWSNRLNDLFLSQAMRQANGVRSYEQIVDDLAGNGV